LEPSFSHISFPFPFGPYLEPTRFLVHMGVFPQLVLVFTPDRGFISFPFPRVVGFPLIAPIVYWVPPLFQIFPRGVFLFSLPERCKNIFAPTTFLKGPEIIGGWSHVYNVVPEFDSLINFSHRSGKRAGTLLTSASCKTF